MTSIQFTASACLRLVCESSVAEILHEAGPKVRPALFPFFVHLSLRVSRAYTSMISQRRTSCILEN